MDILALHVLEALFVDDLLLTAAVPNVPRITIDALPLRQKDFHPVVAPLRDLLSPFPELIIEFMTFYNK